MHHLKSTRGRIPVRLILVVWLASWALGPVLAAGPCKGLSKSRCEGSASCNWVSGYTTKDGAKVRAYCRAKAGRSSATGAKAAEGKRHTSKTSKAKSATGKATANKGSDEKRKATAKKTPDSKKRSTAKKGSTAKKRSGNKD